MSATFFSFERLAAGVQSELALGMLMPSEQRYLEGYAAKAFTGRGRIVDLGCCTGSSTVPLARGLAANPNVPDKSGHIHAYDRFIWEPWMSSTSIAKEVTLEQGDSFLPVFTEAVSPFGASVITHAGDLLKEKWTGEPIEMLFNDVSKSWELYRKVLSEFVPSLLVGGVLMEQDFVHSFTYWLHIAAYEFREYFAPIGIVPGTATFAFMLAREIPSDLLRAPLPRTAFERGYLDRAFDHSIALVTDDARTTVLCAKVIALADSGFAEEARELLASIEAQGMPEYYAYNLNPVRRRLGQ